MPPPLTSDVLHGDGAGSCEFPRHPKGFVAQLLVHQCTLEKKSQDLASKNLSRSHRGSLDKWLCGRLTSFVGRLQQQVDRIQREDGDGGEQNPVKRREGSSRIKAGKPRKHVLISKLNASYQTWDQFNDKSIVLTAANKCIDTELTWRSECSLGNDLSARFSSFWWSFREESRKSSKRSSHSTRFEQRQQSADF